MVAASIWRDSSASQRTGSTARRMAMAGRLTAVDVQYLLLSFRKVWNMVHLKDGMWHSPVEFKHRTRQTGTKDCIATVVPEP
jgi:hypothetical protein